MRLFRRGAELSLFLLAGAALFGGALWVAVPTPREELSQRDLSPSVADRAGHILRVGLTSRHDRSLWCPLKDMGSWLPAATVAAEDARFYRHHGVDPMAMARAVAQYVANKRITSGGSTLTMQLAKLCHPAPRTLRSKGVEIVKALKIERRLSKNEILEQYLNRAPYGGNHVGARTASLHYFGKDLADLSLGEVAILAGLPQSPTRLRPDLHPEACLKRRDYVLDRMSTLKWITPEQCRAAQAEPLPRKPDRVPFRAPHFCDLVLSRSGAKTLTTTLDSQIQAVCERALRDEVRLLRPMGVTNGAAVVLDVKDGNVLALVGSVDFFSVETQGKVNGAVARRSPGSALKPFLYASAFDRGWLTPEIVLPDAPSLFGEYEPTNYDGGFSCLVKTRDALRRSLNVPAVVVLKKMSPVGFHQVLRRLGLSTIDKPAQYYGLSLTLGGCEVTLLDLCNAYACLARGGLYRPYRLLQDDPEWPGERVFSREAAYWTWEILSEESIEPCLPACTLKREPMRVAWKTGTSYGHKDAWTVGFTPEVVVGVWMGNFPGDPAVALVGRDAAAPVVARIMSELYGVSPVPLPPRPPLLEERALCAVSGLRAGPHCPRSVRGEFIRNRSINEVCTVHRAFPVDLDSGKVVCEHCRRGRETRSRVFEIWPAEVVTYAKSLASLPPHDESCTWVASAEGPRIVSPLGSETYFLLADSEGEQRSIPLRAAAAADTSTLYWFADGSFLGESSPGQSLLWVPSRGQHAILCSDDRGRSTQASMEVRW